MLTRLSPWITRGVVDNTTPGRVILELETSSCQEPVSFNLPGDCLRDIAGSRVEFTNPSASLEDGSVRSLLLSLQKHEAALAVGDMTLSLRRPIGGEEKQVGNVLYLEFFARPDARFLVELEHFASRVSLPQRPMSWEEGNTRVLLNADQMRQYVAANVEQYKMLPPIFYQAGFPLMNWDRLLLRAESCLSFYPEVYEKYHYVPGGYLTAAYVMDRHTFLGNLAAADESNQPPNMELIHRPWQLEEFLPEDRLPQVECAMRHPAHVRVGEISIDVERLFLGCLRESDERQSGIMGQFLATQTSTNLHLLGTLLLIQEGVQDTVDIPDRLHVLQERLKKKQMRLIPHLPETIIPEVRSLTLCYLQGLEEFSRSLKC